MVRRTTKPHHGKLLFLRILDDIKIYCQDKKQEIQEDKLCVAYEYLFTLEQKEIIPSCEKFIDKLHEMNINSTQDIVDYMERYDDVIPWYD